MTIVNLIFLNLRHLLLVYVTFLFVQAKRKIVQNMNNKQINMYTVFEIVKKENTECKWIQGRKIWCFLISVQLMLKVYAYNILF